MDLLKTALTKWVAHIEKQESYKVGHCEKVANLATKIADNRYFNAHQEIVWIAAILQNIGITNSDAAILDNHNILDDNEFLIINLHPEKSIEKIEKISLFHHLPHKEMLKNIILCHHKWYNGQGYPGSIRKKDIPIESHIINIADSYIAMRSLRPHRRKKSKDEAIKVIKKGVESHQYEPQVAMHFINILKRYPH